MTCDPATCPNGKCNATGECVERMRPSIPLAVRLRDESGPRLPQMVAQRRAQLLDLRPSDCPSRLREEGKAYPRSCRHCGIRKCQYESRPVLSGPKKGRTIIAFTGLAGAGKSTAAAHLVTYHGFQRIRFAGPLKAMMAALGCTSQQIDGSEKETPCDLLCGKTPRQAMQWLGTEFGRNMIGDDLWIRAWKATVAEVPSGVPVVVDDCRFPNEAEAVRAAGGIIIRIDRPGAGTTSIHSSEQHQIDAIDTLYNNADEQYLRTMVDALIRERAA